MKKIALLFIFFVFISLTSYSQECKYLESQIKFSPLRIVNFKAPGFELSYEIGYGKLSTQLSSAYLIDIAAKGRTRKDLKGMRFNIEEKYVIKATQNQRFRHYLSFEIGYNHVNYVEELFFNNYDENGKYLKGYWVGYDKKSRSIIVDAKTGIQAFAGNIVFDCSIGIGIIFKNVIEYDKPRDYESDNFLDFFWETAGRHTMFNLPISFKIGYRFKHKSKTD